ncbi:MAG TPA: hypothetical protein VK568_14140 [Thermodesulfobacteriota bacterium]|nr:hypothetical protein [Thermodesulfobacteriota bacterium]
MASMQKVEEVREKLRFIKRVIDTVYDLYDNDCFYLMDKDSLLNTLCGVSEAIDEVTGLIEEDEWDGTNLPS